MQTHTQTHTGKKLFTLEAVTAQEVHKILSRLPDGKAPGYDGIDNKLLRICSDIIAQPLAYIVNLSFAKGTFPAKWKHAKVIPLLKDSSKPLSGQNSRPVSLLPTCGKVCEIIASEQIVSYFSQSGHQSEAQHAYRKLHSTETVLLKMTDEWLDSMDKGLMTSVVLLDYSAAFDLVDHTLLLRKLTRYGFSEEALSWTKSYLSKRNWQVYANGAYSKERVLQCGVPQGSCLGPQLYSIYVNDMSSTVENGELDQYADDSTVHAAGHTVQDIRTKALVDLECVAKWSDHNMLKLNNDKTKAMLLRGQSLQQVPTVKLLGVQVDQNLTFDDHIDLVVKKCNRSMAQVSRVRKSLLPKHRIELIQALVLTHLDYCSSVWASTSAKNIKRLQVIQNRAARLALGCDRYTSKDRLLEKLGWLPVKDRVHQKGLRTFRPQEE
ncbi:hypothetical protein Bbelb_302040 [Branchiostoma belcheri]|nr:hypothetical protein Bbelb_302040 [Branchiostoma belcheri]